VLALLVSFTLLVPPDPVPVPLSSLQTYVVPEVRWTYPVLGKGQNGWELARKAARSKVVGLDSVDWNSITKPWPTPPGLAGVDGAKVIAANASRIALEKEALCCPRWVAPPVPDLLPISKRAWGTSDEFPIAAGHRAIAKALVVRAYSEFNRSDEMAAVRDLATIGQIGSRYASGDGLFIDHLVGIAIENIGHRAIQRSVEAGQISPVGATYLLGELPDRPDASRLAASMRREFHDMFLGNLASMGHVSSYQMGGLGKSVLRGHPNPYDLPETVRTASRIYAVVVADMSKPYGQRHEIEPLIDSLSRDLPALMRDEDPPKPTEAQIRETRLALRKVQNPAGRGLIAILLPIFEAAQRADIKALAERRATRFLLQRILDPAANPPRDPFGTGPFRVDERRHVLWSVGSDGVDSGGIGPVGKDRKDIVWRLCW